MPPDESTNGVAHATELWPTKFLEDPAGEEFVKTNHDNDSVALVILHSPIRQFEYFRRLYQHASYRLCADGGANRLHEKLVNQYPKLDWREALKMGLPDCIHGDLDSLNDDVRKRYEELGVEISRDPDEYCPDSAKAIDKVMKERPQVQDLLVLGSLGGRVDHGLGLLNEIFREHKYLHPSVHFWLFSESSVSVILRPGTTVLHTPLRSGLITENVGILPVFGPARISLQGCEWDVVDWPTEMGGQVSTSNHIVADRVTITTDNDVLFTVERKTSEMEVWDNFSKLEKAPSFYMTSKAGRQI